MELGGQGQDGCHVSDALREFCTYYATKLSYQEVSQLVLRVSGQPLVSDQTIWRLAEQMACTVSEAVQERVDATQAEMPAVSEQVDVYSEEPETLIYADAILVTRQKNDRQPAGDALAGRPRKTPGSKATASGRVSMDVLMVQRRDGGFEYLTAGIGPDGREGVGLEGQARALLSREYADRTENEPLSMVAISDGAKAIRSQLAAIVGHAVTLILDWFHLGKKVCEKMTMVARNKQEKLTHIKETLRLLWRGDTPAAIDYLLNNVVCRNEQVRDELVAYLQNHSAEIIDYGKRRDAGKSIGSGRVEKGVDQVVGQRQKRDGMSWTDRGCQALTVLRTAILNNEWKSYWPTLYHVTG